ncbi:MAG: hypothetical protein J0L87_09560 [Bacteroidetes bacterium]|nr:hypothetical protein [Bacteroidota bacterium]
MKNILLLFFILLSLLLQAQNDSVPKHGTIKIGKKKDTTYIKASVKFQVYETKGRKNYKSYAELKNSFIGRPILRSSAVIEPLPLVEGYTIPFDYNSYYNKVVKQYMIDLMDKETDTVKIEICISSKGKVYFKDLAKLQRIGKDIVFYDPELKRYGTEKNHTNSMAALMKIQAWEPAYQITPYKDSFKGTTVIKPKKTKLDAIGILTIVFSSTPFIE